MKVAFKSLIAAASFVAAATAGAATVTITTGTTVYKGAKLSGSEVLTLTPDARAVLDVLAANVTAVSPGQVTATRDSDNFFTGVSLATPITSLNVNDVTDDVLSLASGGGLLVTAPVLRGVSSGGSLSLTDLNVDLASKKVFATIVGANGVGTVSNVALWDFDTLQGSTNVGTPWGGTTVSSMVVSGLRLTTDGVNKVVSALGLGNLGRAAVQGISDFGSIALTVTATTQTLPACAVTFKTTNKNTPVFNTEVTVQNASSNATAGWQVNWNYSKPTLLLNIKNAKITNKALKSYTAQPVKANTTIAAGGSATFSFQGHASGGTPAVSGLTATVGGQTCPVTQAP